MKVKRKYAAIDIAKYVSALLVVCIHTYPFYEISETFNTFFMQTICRIAVPFFFTTSGFFFFRKYGDDPEENTNNLRKYIMRLLKIYLIWTVIYLPYTIWDQYQAGFSILGVFSYIRDFFLNGSYYHLWFLPALMLASVIVFYLYKEKGLVFTLKVSLGAYFVGYLINVYTPVWESIPGINFFFAFFTKTLVTARDGIFFGPIFVSLGLLLAKTGRLPSRTSLGGFVISFLLVVVEVLIYNMTGILRDLTSMYLFLVPAVYFLVNWLLTIKMPYKPIYKVLRNDSLLIYTSHILFAKILLALMPNAHIVVYFLTIALAQAFASLVMYYKGRFPVLENLL